MTVVAGNNNNILSPTATEGYTLVTDTDTNSNPLYTVAAETTEEPGEGEDEDTTEPEIPEGTKVDTDEKLESALQDPDEDSIVIVPSQKPDASPMEITVTTEIAVSVGDKTITVTSSTTLVLDSVDAVEEIMNGSGIPVIQAGGTLRLPASLFGLSSGGGSISCCPPPVFVCWRQHRTIRWLTLSVRAMTRSSNWKTIALQAGTAVS